MKTTKFIFSILAIFLIFQPSLKAQEYEVGDNILGISGSFYSNLNRNVVDETFYNVTVDYRFSQLLGVQLSSGSTSGWSDDNLFAYTTSLGVCVYPDFNSRFSMVPSLGLGISGGAIAGLPDKNVGFMVEVGVLAKYNITDDLYCGFDVRDMLCRDGVSIFVAGIRIGCTFEL